MAAIMIANGMLSELAYLVETEDPDEIPDLEEVATILDELASAIGHGGANVREALLEQGAYSAVCRAWSLCCWSGAPDVPSPAASAALVRDAVLNTLYSLTAGFPDIIDDLGWQIITQTVDKTLPEETQILALKLIRNVCIKSEENREQFSWGLGLLDPLVQLVIKDSPSSEFIREWCATIKAILLSDDLRVPYNRATERKRVIAETRALPILAGFLSKPEYDSDEGALNAIVIFLGTMAVNEDMCLHIESGNVLPALSAIMRNHFHNKTLLRNCVSLLKCLAGNDIIRDKLSGYQFMKLALEVINYYKKEADMVDVAVSCIGFMTLKNACQSSQFITRNGLTLLQQTMLDRNKDITILKGACFALRNVCENSGVEGREKVLELGYATVFSQLLVEVPELKDFYIMPVLRELGLSDLANLPTGEEEEEEEEEEASNNLEQDKPFLLQGEEFGEDPFGLIGF